MVRHIERNREKKGSKNILRNAFSKQNRTAMFVAIFVFGTIGALVGIAGLLIACNVLLVMPFVFGLVNQDVTFTDGKGKQPIGSVGGVIDKTKEVWNASSNTKKAGIIGGIGVMLPIIVILIMWAAVMAVAFAIDLLIVVPIALVVGFFIFRDPARQTNAITKAIGHPVVGVVSIIAVAVIMVFAASQFMEYTKFNGGASNVAEHLTPVSTVAGDTYIDSVYDPATGNWTNTTKPRIAERILFHVVDDYFYGAGFATYLNQSYDTNTSRVNIHDSDGVMPVANAIISINGVAKDGDKYIHLGGTTDGSGDFLFQQVPYGLYEITVDCSGYLKFTKMDVHIDANFTYAAVNVHLKPVYYKIGLEYSYYTSEDVAEDKFGWFGWGKETIVTQNGTVNLVPFLVGALEKKDLDRFHSQQSMWGWSGLPQQTAFTNSMFQLSNTMGFTLNQMTNQIAQSFFLLQSTFSAHVVTTSDWKYAGHNVRMTQALVYTADGLAKDVYSRQFPTANTEIIQNNSDQSFQEYGVSYPNSTNTRSGLTHMVYSYMVWSTVPEAQDMTAQFTVITYVTCVNTTKTDSWFTHNVETTEDTIILEKTVDFKFRINLPTVETLVVGG